MTLDEVLKAQIVRAETIAHTSVFPSDHRTKVGALLIAGDKSYTGANIRRWAWNHTTHAERLALDNALAAGVKSITRVIIYGSSTNEAMSGVVTPCGACREHLAEALVRLGQYDLEIVMVTEDKAEVVIAHLSELLPLSNALGSASIQVAAGGTGKPPVKSVEASLPPHARYPFVQKLCEAKPNPEVLARYLRTIVKDDEAFESACRSMTWLPVGYHTLYVSSQPRLELNFYREDFPGNQDPHSHPAWSRTNWYSYPGSVQKVTYHRQLPRQAGYAKGLPVEDFLLMANTFITVPESMRPLFALQPLSHIRLLKSSVIRHAALGGAYLPPWDVYHVSVEDLRGRVAITTQHKMKEEPAELSTYEGLMNYKQLSPEDATKASEYRSELIGKARTHPLSGQRIGPTGVIYTPPDRNVNDMTPNPEPTPVETAKELILSGLRTAELLAG